MSPLSLDGYVSTRLSSSVGQGPWRRAKSKMLDEDRFHDIGRTLRPLTHMLSNLLIPASEYPSLIGRSVEDCSEVSLWLDSLKSTIGRINLINNRLRQLCHGHEGRPAEVNAVQLVDSVLSDLRTYPDCGPLSIHFGARESECIIYGPYDALVSTVSELVSNAALAMAGSKEGNLYMDIGHCKISEQDPAHRLGVEPGSYVCISFRDEGSGIDPACYETLFDPFVSTRPGDGVGLGLSCVYRFMHHVNGVILYRSVADTGAVFILLFPATMS